MQHIALKISRSLKQEITPYWEEETESWVIAVDEDLECSKLLHDLMADETGECYHSCKGGHVSRVFIRFRQGSYWQGLRPWKDKCRLEIDDGAIDVPIDIGAVLSLLAKPTNPQGDGKAAGEASGSNKQQMSVKRTTVIRV